MAQLIVRNLEEDVKERLRRQASRHGRSVEEEVRDILRNAVRREGQRTTGLGSELSQVFRHIGLKQAIPELKGTKPKIADFSE